MKRTYTWSARPARRNLTVADLRAGKGRRRFFMEDIRGDNESPPRNARAYGDPAGLRRQFREARIAALKAFRADAMGGAFPADEETAGIEAAELERFVERLDALGAAS